MSKRLEYLQVGEQVMFGNGKTGILVAKFERNVIIRQSNGASIPVPTKQVYPMETGTVFKQWHEGTHTERLEMLSKTGLPHKYVNRDWEDLPDTAQNILSGNIKTIMKLGESDEEVEKEGGGAGSGSAMSTSDAGTYNSTYNPKKKNYGTRYGPRQVSAEEAAKLNQKA